jgi:hypothetical protein
MIFRRSERFKRAFRVLPAGVQKKALKAFSLFAENPRHPSLHIKKITASRTFGRGELTSNTDSHFITRLSRAAKRSFVSFAMWITTTNV